MNSSSVDGSLCLFRELRGEWAGLDRVDKKATVSLITNMYSFGNQAKKASRNANTCDKLQQQKIRNPRLQFSQEEEKHVQLFIYRKLMPSVDSGSLLTGNRMN